MKGPKEQCRLTNRWNETILTNTSTWLLPSKAYPEVPQGTGVFCYVSQALPLQAHAGSRSYLLGESPRPQEESQEAADGDRQHREDEQTIPFTNIFDPSEDCIQGHCHAVLPALWRRISIPWGENSLAPLVWVHRSGSVQIRSKHFQFCLADLQGHSSANSHQASSWHYCSKLIPTILLSTTSLRAWKKIRGLWKIRTECSSISKTRLVQNKVTLLGERRCLLQPPQFGVWTPKPRKGTLQGSIQAGNRAVFPKGRAGNILNRTITAGQARWNWTSLIKAGLGFFISLPKKGWMSSMRDTHQTGNSHRLEHARTPSVICHLLSWKWNDFTFLPTTMLIRLGPIYFQRIIRLSHRDCFPFLCCVRIQSQRWFLC